MLKHINNRKTYIIATCFMLAFFSYKIFGYLFSESARADSLDFSNSAKKISIIDNDSFFVVETMASTLEDVLREKNILLDSHDRIIPGKDSSIYPGMAIKIERAVKLSIQVDGRSIESYSAEKTIDGVIDENNIPLGPLDKVSLNIASRPQSGMDIIVTRINVEEKTVSEDIDFKTITKEDPKLGWREQKIEQAGEKGIREVRYKITYKNGVEISRIALEKNTAKEPVSTIVIKGTFMQLGKADKGQGTWYAFKGGLFAASTSLPRGSYARVTNLASGKSVVVQINDYGPFGKDRIIDLDKVAFAKIGSIGSGVIGVKVEEVLN